MPLPRQGRGGEKQRPRASPRAWALLLVAEVHQTKSKMPPREQVHGLGTCPCRARVHQNRSREQVRGLGTCSWRAEVHQTITKWAPRASPRAVDLPLPRQGAPKTEAESKSTGWGLAPGTLRCTKQRQGAPKTEAESKSAGWGLALGAPSCTKLRQNGGPRASPRDGDLPLPRQGAPKQRPSASPRAGDLLLVRRGGLN